MSDTNTKIRGAILVLDDSKAWSPVDFGDRFANHLTSEAIVWEKLKVAPSRLMPPKGSLEGVSAVRSLRTLWEELWIIILVRDLLYMQNK